MDELRLKPYKKEFDFSYTQGVFPSLELVNNLPGIVRKVITSSKGQDNEGVLKLSELCAKNNIPFCIEDKTIERLSPKDNCYAVCVFEKYSKTLDTTANHVVLVNPSDMGNLGTIIRTLTAFGLTELAIISPAADIFDPKTIRASMGALFHINFCYYDSFDSYLQSCGKHDFFPFMLEGGALEKVSRSGTNPFCLIMGNESRGLDESFSKIGTPVRIMHLNTVDSLNLPVATAIGAYYFTKGGFENA